MDSTVRSSEGIVLSRRFTDRDYSRYQKVLQDLYKHPTENADKIARIQQWYLSFSSLTSRMEKNSFTILINDPSFYLETKLDADVWKDCFHTPINMERTKIKDCVKAQKEPVVLVQSTDV